MSFGFVPALLGVFGLVAIAGVLFALQRLRVHTRLPIVIPTTEEEES